VSLQVFRINLHETKMVVYAVACTRIGSYSYNFSPPLCLRQCRALQTAMFRNRTASQHEDHPHFERCVSAGSESFRRRVSIFKTLLQVPEGVREDFYVWTGSGRTCARDVGGRFHRPLCRTWLRQLKSVSSTCMLRGGPSV
jgi:hypothetical protein